MNDAKYIGMDVHQATISVPFGIARNLVMEAILETKAETILQFIRACVAGCTWPLKKEPGRPGCTICSSLTSPSVGQRSAQECLLKVEQE